MNLNLKQKLFGSKLKKMVWLAMLFTAILGAAFIRIVPDYSTPRGFAVVTIFGYNKYKQGYCLKENRILDKEELYKRAIGQYLDYELKLSKMIYDFRVKEYDDFWRSQYELAYYELENINFDNYIKLIGEHQDKTTEEIYMNIFAAKITDTKNFIKIDLKNMSAGFTKPLLNYFGKSVFLMLDKDFILNDDSFGVNFYPSALPEIKYFEIYYGHYRPMQKIYFDRCGKIKYDLEGEFLKSRELKGG
ncbi:hypothetical protein [Campylobacter showae]|uniref:hypothetical protein n=1 Tax=Campylobacter showae TaxID=204 RepID=UPI0028EA8D93|nr:hypothetical protein [Campylobacter showae]